MNANHPINIEALLTHIPLFNGLAPEEIARIAHGTREIHASKGDILFHKGDPCNGFHLLVYGQIKLAFTSAQGNEKVVEILTQGQSFGEAIMFMDKPYIVFAQALTDSLLLHVSKHAVFDELQLGLWYTVTSAMRPRLGLGDGVRHVGDGGPEHRDQRVGVHQRRDAVRAGADRERPARDGRVGDHRERRQRPEGRDRAAFVARDGPGLGGVREREPVHAEKRAQLRPGDLASARHEDEQTVALTAPDDDGLDDVVGPDAAGRGRLGQRAHGAVPGQGVGDPGRLQCRHRACLACHALTVAG